MTNPRKPVLLAIAIAIAVVWGYAVKSPAGASTSAKEGPTEVEIVAAMEQHYFPAIHAHDALIRGNLEVFRAELALLAVVETLPNAPESWEAFDEQLHDAARLGAESADLTTAANAMASVALACGVCHQALEGGPVYPVPPPDEQDDVLKARMREHEVSTLMLWNGISGPSVYAWDLGAAAVAETRIFVDGPPVGVDAKSLLEREAALRELAAEAKETAALPERAELYGRMLATCGGCHRAIGLLLQPH